MIIAAGRGNRLNDLTDNKPKALIPAAGLALIERVILTTKQAGINEFAIVIGYLGEKIKAALGNGEKLGVKIDYIENQEWQKSNGISVLTAKKLINENFMLSMSDHIFDPRILKGLLDNDIKSSVVLAIDRKEPLPGDTKVLERDGKIIEIGKNIEKANCVDTGLFLCSPKIFSYLKEATNEEKTELSDGITKAANNRDASIFDITQIDSYSSKMRKEIKPWWIDVDTKEDLIKAEKMIVENESALEIQ
ncbi:MAG TPA: phosphocholine cytidylyltransferase family protein [Nitrospinota bacterium]|nr:phosphocholine cytidylyltransferase family protein [Nitrospinota bacterium]